MFCKTCGASLPDGAKFCTACGAPVIPEAPVLTPDPAPTKAEPILDMPEPTAPTTQTRAKMILYTSRKVLLFFVRYPQQFSP